MRFNTHSILFGFTSALLFCSQPVLAMSFNYLSPSEMNTKVDTSGSARYGYNPKHPCILPTACGNPDASPPMCAAGIAYFKFNNFTVSNASYTLSSDNNTSGKPQSPYDMTQEETTALNPPSNTLINGVATTCPAYDGSTHLIGSAEYSTTIPVWGCQNQSVKYDVSFDLGGTITSAVCTYGNANTTCSDTTTYHPGVTEYQCTFS